MKREPMRTAAALRNMAAMCVSESATPYGVPLLAGRGQRAIEHDFPFEELSKIADAESWRKEIYRPIYHVHKWWARRLGSVFRAAILAAASPKGSSILDLFYEPVRLPGIVVFDPFMGSGTTVGEAQKLGCTVIGRDINPVAHRAASLVLGPVNRRKVEEHFSALDSRVGPELRELYRSHDSNNHACDVLYFFWVKVVPCPECGKRVELFSNYVFATHARKTQHPTARITCPDCHAVIVARFDAVDVTCKCGTRFNPQNGPAKRTTAVCRNCRYEFPIARAARQSGKPPAHRLYAKLVLQHDGTKEYLAATPSDLEAYTQASGRLKTLNPRLPRVPIADGVNTHQILNYGYRYWHQLFNDRQLLALTTLAGAISELPNGSAREALAVLFSGVLEFNNLFTSYKGEGTGAVRHMFSHHILKPERTPIEASPWGTPKSSGAFSTLFRSRLLRALDYREAPFEILAVHGGDNARKSGRKVVGTSPPMGAEILPTYPGDGMAPGSVYLSCGDSATTDLPAKSVHLIITDPPFFDNVHYSELADFFFVWQQLYFQNGGGKSNTTRCTADVQDADADAFSDKLCRVFTECHRVLVDDGLLVFSYHHSREDGWISVARAVIRAGFTITQSQPVKAELSVATPKSQAREPIDLDVLIVCRKRAADGRAPRADHDALRRAASNTSRQVGRFNNGGRTLSRGDVRVVLLSQLLVELSVGRDVATFGTSLSSSLPRTRDIIESVWRKQEVRAPSALPETAPEGPQLHLFGASVTR